MAVVAVAVAGEDKPVCAGIGVASAARKAERLGYWDAVHGAVGEGKQRRGRRQGAHPGGGAPVGAHGGEADAVDVGWQAPENLVGEIQRVVGPRPPR